MKVQQAVQQQLGFWHGTLESMMGECGDILHKTVPNSTTNTIAATYAHTVLAEDTILQARLRGGQPLFQSGGWEGKTGVPFPGVPPMMTPEWAAKIKMELAPFQEYAKAVYKATDEYLASVPDAELDRTLEGPPPLGPQTVGWYLATLLATHVPQHAGEIAALKGVHGMKGLPF